MRLIALGAFVALVVIVSVAVQIESRPLHEPLGGAGAKRV